MSSGSRRPRNRGAARSSRRPDLTVVASNDQDCDCPACRGEVVDPERMLAEGVDDAADLAEVEDPLEAELAGALFVAMAQAGGDDAVGAFVDGLIPAIEARGSRAALTLLVA